MRGDESLGSRSCKNSHYYACCCNYGDEISETEGMMVFQEKKNCRHMYLYTKHSSLINHGDFEIRDHRSQETVTLPQLIVEVMKLGQL